MSFSLLVKQFATRVLKGVIKIKSHLLCVKVWAWATATLTSNILEATPFFLFNQINK